MIALLFALFVFRLHLEGPVAAPAPPPTATVAAVSRAADTGEAPTAIPSATVADHSPAPATPPPALEPAPTSASCSAGEEWQGEFGCVATQLEGETNGRAYG